MNQNTYVYKNPVMSKIKKEDTKPEMIVRKFLFKNGIRYRLYNKKLIGNPDITLTKYHTVIFINGCFWHAHNNCKYNKLPKSNTSYWTPKIIGNAKRDIENKKELEKLGWKVIIIWECELKKTNQEKTLQELLKHFFILGEEKGYAKVY
jgi:DNA mismatch endonuclease, patch repair protein